MTMNQEVLNVYYQTYMNSLLKQLQPQKPSNAVKLSTEMCQSQMPMNFLPSAMNMASTHPPITSLHTATMAPLYNQIAQPQPINPLISPISKPTVLPNPYYSIYQLKQLQAQQELQLKLQQNSLAMQFVSQPIMDSSLKRTSPFDADLFNKKARLLPININKSISPVNQKTKEDDDNIEIDVVTVNEDESKTKETTNTPVTCYKNGLESPTAKRITATTPDSDPLSQKLHRKAHIEFYRFVRINYKNFFRKVKALKSRGEILECQLCLEEVTNNETAVRSHIQQRHQEHELFICKSCSKGFRDHIEIFDHIKQQHPKIDQQYFEDRRNMTDLTTILQDCFPRGCIKTQTDYRKMFESLMQLSNTQSKSKPLTEFICQECHQTINAEKSTILKHLNQHLLYKCKLCKFLSVSEEQQLEHAATVHAKKLAKQKTETSTTENPQQEQQQTTTNTSNEQQKTPLHVSCRSMDVLTLILKKCFFDFYCSKNSQKKQK